MSMNQDQVDQVTKAIARLKKGEAVSTKGILSVVYVQETLVLKCFKSELVRDEAFEYQTIACANGFGPVAYQIIDPIKDNYSGTEWFCYVSQKADTFITYEEVGYIYNEGFSPINCSDIREDLENIAKEIFNKEIGDPTRYPGFIWDLHFGNLGMINGWPVIIDFS